jgi:predicted phosphodiesterase
MLSAIVSDIHANLQAWNAVLVDIRSMGVDRIICLGDIVGYGPNPREVLESVHANVDHIVLGNHDAVICGKMDDGLFNATARRAIEWTRTRLGSRAFAFLGGLPLTLSARGFRCAHGDFSSPSAFNYVLGPEDAVGSWNAVADPLLFVGHSHVGGIYVLGASGIPRETAPQDFELEPGKRFLVNVGSVGQPRTESVLASYCILDDGKGAVYWRRIPFDLDAFGKSFSDAGLPPEAAAFLERDPRLAAVPLRERLDFSPPADPDRRVKNTVEVQEMASLRRSVSRWRAAVWGVLVVLAATALASGVFYWQTVHRALEIPAPAVPVMAVAASPDSNLLPPLSSGSGSAPLSDAFGVQLSNRERQAATVEILEGEPVIRLRSSTRHPITLRSAPIHVAPGMSFRIEGQVLYEADFDGELSFAAVCSGKTLPAKSFSADPNLRRKAGWMKAQLSFEVPAGAEKIEVRVTGAFVGSVAVKSPALIYRGRE